MEVLSMYEFALDVGEITPTVVTMMSMIDITKKFESLHGRYVITKKAKKIGRAHV